MLKITLLVLVTTLSAGCLAGTQQNQPTSQASKMQALMDRLERDNAEIRRRYALLQQQKGVQTNSAMPLQQPVQFNQNVSAGSVVSKAWVRQSHGVYLCFVGKNPFLSLAENVTFKNDIHNNYGMSTSTNTKKNKWVSIKINAEPVRMLRTVSGGYIISDHLGPGEWCAAELGGSTKHSVVSELWKNKLGRHSPTLIRTSVMRERNLSEDVMMDDHVVTYDRFTFSGR